MGKRILIAENHADISSGIEFLLRHEGHDVEVVCSASDAIERVEDFWPDLAFIEVALPDRSGLALCRELRALPNDSQPYIVLFSNSRREEVQASSGAAGADDLVILPFVTLDLLARLRPHLEEHVTER
ncbi:response regulator transcription factor [Uliginosibacterium gangwonense]|uniref:response regulator transcription factor n=1 Tax=Uliginosibacterium gangwonense TaxID=392736 RepID=UPI0003748F01|nr:response regulator [Uliginosibacterium gangwonense]